MRMSKSNSSPNITYRDRDTANPVNVSILRTVPAPVSPCSQLSSRHAAKLSQYLLQYANVRTTQFFQLFWSVRSYRYILNSVQVNIFVPNVTVDFTVYSV